jgi:tetratricopeptide (TPR) repeat protein
MRRLLQTLLLCIAAAACVAQAWPAAANSPYRFTLPGRQGALEMASGTLQIGDGEYRADGSGFRLQGKSANGVMATVFLEKADKAAATAEEVRDSWFEQMHKASKQTYEEVKKSRVGEFAAGDYHIRIKSGGNTLDHHAFHAYGPAGDVWVEVHLSRTPAAADDQLEFEKVLSGFKLLPDYKLTPEDYFGHASWFYGKQAYKQAAAYYEEALRLQDQKPTLSKELWFVAMDNLGMSYGISGDLQHARGVFEKGIAAQPEYPLFYYNLACAFGEMNDMDAAIANLQRAFERRKNVLRGESMPDPMTDDSFRNFVKNKKFIAAVEALPKG